jgi:hypothetical protein
VTLRLSKAQRATLAAMFDGACAYCGKPLGERWHADHFKSIERKMAVVGRKFVSTSECHKPENDTIENFRPSCAPCNISKATLDIEQWRIWLAGHLEALNRYQSTYRLMKTYGLVVETGAPVVFHFERIAAQTTEPS